MFNAVQNEIKRRRITDGSEFKIHRLDATDLGKLKPEELVSLNFDSKRACQISNELVNGKFETLQKTMGVKFLFTYDVQRLLPD